jgi:diguanylate cyclase (GGDEF)-like protein
MPGASQLEEAARHDPLTDLPNRTLITERIASAVMSSRESSQLVGVYYADLDRFRFVNHGCGHAVGDELLRSLAERLGDMLRPGDTLGRFGGNAFVLVRPGIEGEVVAMQVADRLLAALSHPVDTSAGHFNLEASIGVALGNGSASPEDLLREADTAMHHVKEHGGGGHRRFEPEMLGDAMQQVECERALRLAISREELVLHYQPVVGMRSGQVPAFEALVRWEHPALGLLGPDQFVPAAERSAAIHQLGRWALRAACRQIAAWTPQAPGAAWANVAVNVSARQLCAPGFPAEVAAALHDAGVPSHRLALEITETALMDAPATAVDALREIKATGVRVLLDDFGTGHSSLRYLSRLPVDAIKLDRSFISGPEAGRNRAIVDAVAGMARALGLHLVGEGVETAEQAAHLAAVGCEFGQGFLYSRPMPAEDVAGWMGAAPARVHPAPQPIAPRLRALACIDRPLPDCAALLRREADALLDAAANGLYELDAAGWMADAASRPALREWLRSVAEAAASGSEDAALRGTDELVRKAQEGGASLLEISLYVDRFASLASLAGRRAQVSAVQRAASEHLFGQVRRQLLAGR